MSTEPFQTPENLPYEFLGYYEEWHDIIANKHLGICRVEKADRLLGVQGAIEFKCTEAVPLMKGHKEYVFNASRRSIKVRVTLQILCGTIKK